MLKSVALVVGAALGALLLFAATRPDTFRVARSTLVQAPPERLQPLIADLHQFNTWNPYAKKDPQMRGEYRGPASGPGATYLFAGDKSGQGSIRVLETAPQAVTMELLMQEPLAARNHIRFTLAPRAGATEVTWAMEGASPFLAKVAGLFFDMDRMIGNDFEAGLADLKLRAERG